MTYDVKQLSISLFPSYVFFGEVFVKVFSSFLINLFAFLLFTFKSFFLCILDNSPLFYIAFANAFSQLMACLFYSLNIAFQIRNFSC